MTVDIEFVADWFAEVEKPAGRLTQVAYRRGDRLRAEVRPAAAVAGADPTADLALAGGGTALRVPLSRFAVAAGRAVAA